MIFGVLSSLVYLGHQQWFSANILIQPKPPVTVERPLLVLNTLLTRRFEESILGFIIRGRLERAAASLAAERSAEIVPLPEVEKVVTNTSTPTVRRPEVISAPMEQVSMDVPESPPVVVESIGLPRRINIPGIGVNAAIERVALAADGSMGVPKQRLNTSWYELGPRPGEVGSATIAGHLNWFNGATGVFANLQKLSAGDLITVEDDKGMTVTFVVREIRSYAAAADASGVFYSSDGLAHLNLITCSGEWDKDTQQYSDRLVVFTDRVVE